MGDSFTQFMNSFVKLLFLKEFIYNEKVSLKVPISLTIWYIKPYECREHVYTIKIVIVYKGTIVLQETCFP